MTHANIGLTRMTLSPIAVQLLGMFVARWNRVYTLAAIVMKKDKFAGETRNGTYGPVLST